MKTSKPRPFLMPAINSAISDISIHLGAMTTTEVQAAFAKMTARMTASMRITAAGIAKLEAARSAWAFGTVHRNLVTDERVMAVGHRQVIGLTYRSQRRMVTDTVEDWFDFWEVEPGT